VRDEAVLGWASSTRLRPKPAYDRSVETTVYLDPDATGCGLGRLLYDRLLGELEAAGVHRAYAVIALPNPVSVAFHERYGYRRVGLFEEVGYKFDRYWDVAWYERPF
jgi:phosphinothricin acetyltransferase